MAGSRLEKFGTVFSRVRDLMRSGVIKSSNQPVWYEVYAAFPPKREPLYVKPHSRPHVKTRDPVPEIYYQEDHVRAKFYELYGPGPRPLDLSRSDHVSVSQRFVEKWTELQRDGDVDDSVLMEETGKALLADGVLLRRRRTLHATATPEDSKLNVRLKDMWAEHQETLNTKNQQTPSDHFRPPQTSTDPHRPSETSLDQLRPPQTSSDHLRPPQTSSDPLRPPQTPSVHIRPPQTPSDHLRPPETSSDLLRPPQTSSDLLRPPQTRSGVS